MQEKIVIHENDLHLIREYGIKRFHEEYELFKKMSNSDMQIYLIIYGLEYFLNTKKITPQFELAMNKKEKRNE